MMKSEYNRCYYMHENENEDEIYGKKRNRETQSSEPRMTHKRRVKLGEDNVIIGEPLLHQSIGDTNGNIPYQERKKTINGLHKMDKYKKGKTVDKELKLIEQARPRKIRLVNEAVQTDDFAQTKTTQVHNKVPCDRREAWNARKGDNGDLSPPRRDDFQRHGDKYKDVKGRDCGVNWSEGNKGGIYRPIESKQDRCDREIRMREKGTSGHQEVDYRNDKSHKVYGKDSKAHKDVPKLDRQEKSVIKSNLVEVLPPAAAKTEYQTRYSWRDPVEKGRPQTARSTQMMSSLDTKLKIYNNFISEYQRQFRPYEFVTENRFKKMKPTSDTERVFEGTQLQFMPDRVEQRRALTPPPRINPKKATRKVQDTMNPQKANFPHGKQKRFLTEYSANYDNKWERLDAEMNQSIEERAQEANTQAKWFQEILELRKKAQEYRQRARGTHFSREHLGQVYRKTTRAMNEHRRRSSPEGPAYRNFRGNTQPAPGHSFSSPMSSDRGSIAENASTYGSLESTVVGRPRSRSHSPSPQSRTAGKPTNDDSVLLDEQASHDTDIKSFSKRYSPVVPLEGSHSRHRPGDDRFPIKDERKYTLEKYFDIKNNEQDRDLRTLDYDSVGKDSSRGHVSSRSIVSSSTMSLALETLERAKRNRDGLLRQKS